MNLAEWCSTQDRVKAALDFLNSEFGKDFMEILEQGAPARLHPLPPVGSSSDDKIMAYGQQMGYHEALARIKAMAIFAPPSREVESSYEDPNNPVQLER